MMHYATECLKFKRLVRRLRGPLGAVPVEPETIVVGLLERLWHLAIREARNGCLAKFAAEDIAELIGWTGEANVLIEALVGERWLDADSRGGLKIHDWDDHKPNWLKGVDAREASREASREAKRLGSLPSTEPSSQLGQPPGYQPSNEPSQQPSNVPSAVPASREQDHTIPDDTRPNQTIENKNLAAASLAAARFDFARFADTEAQRIAALNAAKKLDLVAGKVLGREYIWRVAWISEAVTPGFCSEIFTKIKTGKVENFKRYIDGALRGELQQVGLTIPDCVNVVPPLTKKPERATA